MKPVFEIIPEAIFFQQTNLICEVSADSFSCIFCDNISKKFHGLFVFHLIKGADLSRQLKETFSGQPLLQKQYKKIYISYTGEESALLPEELYRSGENQGLLNNLYGDKDEAPLITDLIAEKKIYNVYRLPAPVHQVMVEQFPLAAFGHQYSILIKQEWEGNVLRVIFYRSEMLVVLFKEGSLQLIHSYPYHSATDVVYHLLNICNHFTINDAPLHVGGMIEKERELHNELSHYFPTIIFDHLPAGFEYTDKLKALPEHYFSHLFSVASCV